MWANVADSITLDFAGEVAIVFCMSFVLVCSVISLASAEWEGHEDEREPRAAGEQSSGPQKHLAATSCGERIRVVETMPAPKRERIARTENVVKGKEKRQRDGPAQPPTCKGTRLHGSDEHTPSRARSKGMRRSSSHESLTSSPFEGLRRSSSSDESLQLSQSSTPTRPKGMRRSSSHESLTSAPFEELQSLTPTRLRDSVSHESLTSTEGDHFRRRHTSSHESLASECAEVLSRTSSCASRASSCKPDESLQISQSSTPTRPKGMRRSSSHESLTSAPFRSSSDESLQLSQSSKPTRSKGMRRSSSHESLTSSPFEGLRRSSSHESLASSFGSLGSLSTMRRNNWSSTSLHSITEDSDLYTLTCIGLSRGPGV